MQRNRSNEGNRLVFSEVDTAPLRISDYSRVLIFYAMRVLRNTVYMWLGLISAWIDLPSGGGDERLAGVRGGINRFQSTCEKGNPTEGSHDGTGFRVLDGSVEVVPEL